MPLAFIFNAIFFFHIKYVSLWRLFNRPILFSLYFCLHSIFLLQMLLTCYLRSTSKSLIRIHDLRLAKTDFAFLFWEMITLRFLNRKLLILRLFIRKNIVCLNLDAVFNYLSEFLSFSWVKVGLCLFNLMKNIILLLKNLFVGKDNLLTLQWLHLLLIFTKFHRMIVILKFFNLLVKLLYWLI